MELKNISQAELDEILKQHYVWFKSDGSKGHRAVLSYTDLWGANLRNADLWNANLYGADLCGADLQSADLRGADLEEADLQGADLSGADLWRANLYGADLQGANLQEANLQYTSLQGADLWKAALQGAKMDSTTKGINNQCPKTGYFVGYKKAFSKDRKPLLVTLEIPKDAERSNSTSEKCRCSKAKVLSITTINTGKHQEVAYGHFDGNFKYQVGKTVVPDEWDSRFWKNALMGFISL